ncbi:helix-turn-helix transcriptional regulator [Rhizobium sp. L1K21]|uniref:ArsR/SmtB family transcription factor n=1 Tax=Rhizobium sp. L1K21 TaxID=2954933 RepID=UPI0020928C87|nr:metalloregulator ArsR/SmtB family transcription factor [Rhizobium sp. L1K21]MCO6188324.1 metalloregulator ArsR/SmtB family transcription factor [Rhizobium sp. L1K21]
MAKFDHNLNRMFSALGDETRRAVVARLARGPASVSELAASHKMALPSFMGHLTKLEDAGLIATSKEGRVRTCRLLNENLTPLNNWLVEQQRVWEKRLDQFDTYVEQRARERNDAT